jgi:hypothetical protein
MMQGVLGDIALLKGPMMRMLGLDDRRLSKYIFSSEPR